MILTSVEKEWPNVSFASARLERNAAQSWNAARALAFCGHRADTQIRQMCRPARYQTTIRFFWS